MPLLSAGRPDGTYGFELMLQLLSGLPQSSLLFFHRATRLLARFLLVFFSRFLNVLPQCFSFRFPFLRTPLLVLPFTLVVAPSCEASFLFRCTPAGPGSRL